MPRDQLNPLTGTNLSHPTRFCPAYHSRASGGPKSRSVDRPLMEEETDRDFTKKVDLASSFLPFLTWEVASAVECRYILSFFYIFDTLCSPTHQQPPAGPDAEQRQPFLFGSVPCPAGLRFEAGPWGGMRLSSRESLPPQKFISHMDFSFLHSLKT